MPEIKFDVSGDTIDRLFITTGGTSANVLKLLLADIKTMKKQAAILPL